MLSVIFPTQLDRTQMITRMTLMGVVLLGINLLYQVANAPSPDLVSMVLTLLGLGCLAVWAKARAVNAGLIPLFHKVLWLILALYFGVAILGFIPLPLGIISLILGAFASTLLMGGLWALLSAFQKV